MKIISVSDIHMRKDMLSKLLQVKGDMLLICGDFSHTGTKKQLNYVLDIISKCDFKYIVATTGNHDIDMERNLDYYKEKYPKIKFLNNEIIEIEGIKIYGSPYCVDYGGWAFPYYDKIDCKQKTLPKENVDIIISHEPPYDRDLGFIYDKKYGNFYLRVLLEISEKAPQVLFCGHIHENGGVSKKINNTMCFNCAGQIIEYEFENRD